MRVLSTGHTTLLWRWINVIDVDSASQQRRIAGGCVQILQRRFDCISISSMLRLWLQTSRNDVVGRPGVTQPVCRHLRLLVALCRWQYVYLWWHNASCPSCATHYITVASQQTTEVHQMLFLCWTSVVDGGPTLKQHWFNTSCFMAWASRPRPPGSLPGKYASDKKYCR